MVKTSQSTEPEQTARGTAGPSEGIRRSGMTQWVKILLLSEIVDLQDGSSDFTFKFLGLKGGRDFVHSFSLQQ